ncbi:MAG: hypothetical protein SOX10_03690 [Duodenibacillus sp.]|nr:hypothetical protein [Duodenibacillus sp.]
MGDKTQLLAFLLAADFIDPSRLCSGFLLPRC